MYLGLCGEDGDEEETPYPRPRAGTGWKMVNRPVRITCQTGEIPAKAG